jgi:protoporphyrinogen/coproporphyrinogen III oxidase
MQLTASNSDQPVYYDKIISTLLAKTLHRLTGPAAIPSLANEDAVTILAVSVIFPEITDVFKLMPTFGYLIPQSVPLEQNPECALGVLFDRQNSRRWAKETGNDSNPPLLFPTGETFTVLFGGHYWAGLPPPPVDEAARVEMARSVLRRHLGIEEYPAIAQTKLCVDCIPQHRPGHRTRMAAAHAELLRNFDGRLAVLGGSFHAQGVTAGMRYARDMAMHTAGMGYEAKDMDPWMLDHVGQTGLARFQSWEMEHLAPRDPKDLPFRFGNGPPGSLDAGNAK